MICLRDEFHINVARIDFDRVMDPKEMLESLHDLPSHISQVVSHHDVSSNALGIGSDHLWGEFERLVGECHDDVRHLVTIPEQFNDRAMARHRP